MSAMEGQVMQGLGKVMSLKDNDGQRYDLAKIEDQTGKVVLVTGANSSDGIGYHTAEQLALKGATVYVGARSVQKAKDAIKSLSASGKISAAKLKPFVADLGDLKAVHKAAQEFASSESRLDTLILNAGLMGRALDVDANGISVSMTTNYFAPWILTTTLLPLLKKTAQAHPGVRIVNVSSSLHLCVPDGRQFRSKEDFNNTLGSENSMPSNLARYGLSKLAGLLFISELEKKFKAENIPALAISLHPGRVKTTGVRTLIGPGNEDKLHDSLEPIEGAMTSIFAAGDASVWNEKSKYAGAYLMPFGVISEPSTDAQKPELASQLWSTTEKVVAGVL